MILRKTFDQLGWDNSVKKTCFTHLTLTEHKHNSSLSENISFWTDKWGIVWPRTQDLQVSVAAIQPLEPRPTLINKTWWWLDLKCAIQFLSNFLGAARAYYWANCRTGLSKVFSLSVGLSTPTPTQRRLCRTFFHVDNVLKTKARSESECAACAW